MMNISVMLNSLPHELELAIEVAAKLGVDAVQIPLTHADQLPFRASLLRIAGDNGVLVSATAVNLGDWGEAASLKERCEAAKPLIDMTRTVGTSICQTHVGIMPYTASGPRWDSFLRTAELLSTYAESMGVCIAIETGPEPPHVMEKLMQAIDSHALGVNYDPANLILWPAALPHHPERQKQTEVPASPYDPATAEAEFEPVVGVKRLAPYIVHTHAKDAVADGSWDDVPLGQGEIDWSVYLQCLREIGFEGYLGIERECGHDREREIGDAVSFLRAHLQHLEASQLALV